MEVMSFVVPHRDRELGLEFRTRNSAPDEIQRHILASFRFHSL